MPAPYGGLNTRDDITALKINEARVLENWLPTDGQVSLRDGFVRHVGGMASGTVDTLASFYGLTSTAMLACGNSNIYEVPSVSANISGATKANPCVITTSTSHGLSNSDSVYIKNVSGMTELNGNTYTVANVTADTFELSATDSSSYTTYVSGGEVNKEAVSLASGFTVNRWQHALYNDRLLFVNGTDAPQDYDGSTVQATSWTGTGLTITNLVNIALVRNRLWFCENNSSDVWYAGIASITGALTKFQLSRISKGGTCMAIGSWSRDAGDGADDFTVFVMSTGELIIYQGDPATTFTLVGRFSGAVPLGRQCLVNVGGELVVLTRLGLLPVSSAIAGVALDLARIDPWGKIAPTFVKDAKLHGDKVGWHAVLHEGVLHVNVPQSVGALSKQYVLNTRNGAWTIYTGWNASALCSCDNELYFGDVSGGRVVKTTPGNDDGTDVTAVGVCSFVTPSNSYTSNLFTGIRPKVNASGSVTGRVGVDTDFVLRSAVSESVSLVDDPSRTPWGSEWGSPWGAVAYADLKWFSITGNGRSVAVRLRATANSQDLKWFATDLVFKQGGIR